MESRADFRGSEKIREDGLFLLSDGDGNGVGERQNEQESVKIMAIDTDRLAMIGKLRMGGGSVEVAL